ncbi:tyrosine-type recombinase/integrase [Nocardiopsis suaedae]|uniref:Tyrosine-type recombinase/integrase n=1 Tax=Nocardiopsis suaedae TaxID=3018444 RepID=A0ABT4TIQ2_9ACTN|nr:tyrosine-type recombinase/integrase [Nocardiopsis suaedae]MDA2804578.1 tyrosine-type recombinase/integrase [Nocardiopsis suaedae]
MTQLDPAGRPSVGDRPSTFNVKLWNIRTYKGKRKTTYTVRWKVNGKLFPETFDTESLALSRRNELLTAQAKGIAFDVELGVPVTEVPAILARQAEEEEEEPELTWYEHCVNYVERRHKWLAANSRRSVADTLATILPVLLPDAPGRPEKRQLRLALYQWAFDKNRREREDMPPHVENALQWVADHSPPASALADPDKVLTALEAIGSTQKGKRASGNTIARKRAVLSNVLEFGVGEFLDGNPLPAASKKWNPPKAVEEVDPRVVINPEQAVALLDALRQLPHSGPKLVAFFGCLYYGGLRPSEAVRLRRSNLDIPMRGSGTLVLEDSGPVAGRTWTDSGKRRDKRGLKWRGDKEVRYVPCPPELTELLREHLAVFGTNVEGYLFRGHRGGELSESVYERLLKRARMKAFTPEQVASPMARRPYDLRHACLSAWLNAGIDPAQVAHWAGNSVRVLLGTYAKCVSGREAINRSKAEQATRADPPAPSGD